jgi:hypothetical protein
VSCGCTTPVQTYWKNWGPRLGIIYQLDSKTVIRSGFGVTYSQGGGTGGGELSGGVGGANSSGQILGSSVTALSANDVTTGQLAGPSYWLSSNTGYLNGATVSTAVANTALGGPSFTYPALPAPGVATQILDAGNYINAAGTGVVTPAAMGYDDPYQSGRASEYTFYNLGFERSITKDMTLNVAYVGSESHHTFNKSAESPRGYWNNQINPIYLLALGPVAGTTSAGKAAGIPMLLAPATTVNVNAVNALLPGAINVSQQASFIAAANAFPTTSTLTIGQLLTAFPQYSQIQDSWGGPNTENYAYNALQIVLSQRLAHGLTFNVNYTYAKDLGDDTSFRSAFTIPVGAVDGSQKTWKADKIDRSYTGLDLPQNVVAYGVYKLPIGAPGQFGGNTWLMREIIGGWSLSGVYTYGSGGPVGVTWSGGCSPSDTTPTGGVGTLCVPSYNPSFVGSPRINGSYGTGPNGVVVTNKTIQYLTPTAFQTPTNISTVSGQPQYLLGNVSRNAPYGLRAEGNQNLNATLQRSFPLPHDTSFVFRADCGNVWNKQTWGGPSGSWSVGSTTFGEVGTPGAIRDWQFSGRINF